MDKFIPEVFRAALVLFLAVVGVLVVVAVLLVAIGQLIYPMWSQCKRRRLLTDKFSRGLYDEGTIELVTRYYIRPKCSNIDPGQEKEIRHALAATREDLFTKIDYFLDHDDSHRHVLILADAGMGKTSFVLNYYVHNTHRSRFKRHNIALVPLGAKDADELIKNIPDQDETILFLDALDEDTKAIADHRQRIRDLMHACYKFKRVIITCRTQFFPKDEEIPSETGIVRLGPRQAGDKGTYEFWKLYLSPFDDKDTDTYVKKRYPIWQYRVRKKARNMALRIPSLSARPMLLAHIPDLIDRNVTINHVYELYKKMIDAWLERETRWVNKDALREFSERLAVDIYRNREQRGMESVPYEELPLLAQRWNIPLQQWQLSGRSLLNRDAQGNYKFAHRSIMEYLFVVRLLQGDPDCYNVILTDQMKQFLKVIELNTNEIPKSIRDVLSEAWIRETEEVLHDLISFEEIPEFDREAMRDELSRLLVSHEIPRIYGDVLIDGMIKQLPNPISKALPNELVMTSFKSTDENSQLLIRELSHQLFTPLSLIETAILSLSAMNDSTDNSIDMMHTYLKSIKTSVELCKSTLTAYRGIIALTGKSSNSWSPTSIVEMLNAAAEVYRGRFNSSIKIEIIMPQKIEGYPNSYIVGLLLPILENAIEASTDFGKVSIIGHQLNNYYSIEVANNTNNPPPVSYTHLTLPTIYSV